MKIVLRHKSCILYPYMHTLVHTHAHAHTLQVKTFMYLSCISFILIWLHCFKWRLKPQTSHAPLELLSFPSACKVSSIDRKKYLFLFLFYLVSYQILLFLENASSSLFEWPPPLIRPPPPTEYITEMDLISHLAMYVLEAVARSFFHKSHFHHFTCYSKFSVAFH